MKMFLLILAGLGLPFLFSSPSSSHDTFSVRHAVLHASVSPVEIMDDLWPADNDDEVVTAQDGGAPLETIALYPNYPNPFNPETEVGFDLPRTMPVSVVVYDILGQQIRTLADGVLSAGHHVIYFDGSELPSGTYYCKLTTPGVMQTRKMVLMK